MSLLSRLYPATPDNTPNAMLVVDLLNLLLSILFPLWPWEPFFVMPFVFEILKCSGKIQGVILFLTIFAALFCFAHGAPQTAMERAAT